MRRALPILCCGALACLDPQALPPPETPTTGAQLWISRTSNGALGGLLVDGPTDDRRAFQLQVGDELYRLDYQVAAVALGLPTVLLPAYGVCTTGPAPRRVPPADRYTGFRWGEEGLRTLDPVDVSSSVATISLGPDSLLCPNGLCLTHLEEGWSCGDCGLNPQSPVQAPAPPIPPQPPCVSEPECVSEDFRSSADCEPGSRQPLDAPECQPVGAACPPGLNPWPSGASNNWTFVDVAGRPGGVGTPDDPSSDLVGALAGAPSGATVVIRGQFPLSGPLHLPSKLTLLGVCPAQSGLRGTVRIDAGGKLQDLQIEANADEAGLVVAGGRAEVVGVVVRGAEGSVGIEQRAGAALEVEDASIEGFRRGLVLEGSATLQQLSVRDFSSEGLLAQSATISLRLASIGPARLAATGDPGISLKGGDAHLAHVLVSEFPGVGVALDHAKLRAEHLRIEQSRGPSAGIYGLESEVTLSRLAVVSAGENGINLTGTQTASISDLLVGSDPRFPGGTAITLGTTEGTVGPQLHLHRAKLVGPGFGNVLVLRRAIAGTVKDCPAETRNLICHQLSDLEIDGTDSGDSVAVQGGGASVVARRVLIQRWPADAVNVRDGGSLQMEDLRVAGPGRQALRTKGTELVRMARVQIEGQQAGLDLDPGNFELSDLSIRKAAIGVRGFRADASGPLLGPRTIRLERFRIEATEAAFEWGGASDANFDLQDGYMTVPGADPVHWLDDCVDPRTGLGKNVTVDPNANLAP